MVAKLLCQAIFRDEQMRGAPYGEGQSKVLAYADDIAIGVGNEVDTVRA